MWYAGDVGQRPREEVSGLSSSWVSNQEGSSWGWAQQSFSWDFWSRWCASGSLPQTPPHNEVGLYSPLWNVSVEDN